MISRYEDWGTIGRPANLTAGIYRGGRTPLDFYNRVHAGINGTAMTAIGATLSNEEIWEVITFIQALPYRKMLPEDVRNKIYVPEIPADNTKAE